MFCMFLRKHLSGARLSGIRQLPMERWAEFVFDCTDEMGYPVQKKLVAELMGRTCNLYLLDGEGRILDCLRRIGLDDSARPALPGLSYRLPEQVTKKMRSRRERLRLCDPECQARQQLPQRACERYHDRSRGNNEAPRRSG